MPRTPGRIVIVEDDAEDEDFIVEGIRSTFGFAPEVIRTENDFMKALSGYIANPPDVIVMDIMLRWAFPAPELEAADPEPAETFHAAGIRCLKALRAAGGEGIPVVVYSALTQDDFNGTQVVLTKSDQIDDLMDAIRNKLG